MTTYSNIQLQTERLKLRPLVESDGPAIFSIYSDPEVMKYWSTPPWKERGKADDMIRQDIEALSCGQSIRLGLELSTTNQLIGNCSIFNIDRNSRRAELGYILARDYWNTGVMTEALEVLVDFAFCEMGLHRLEADIDPRNRASEKMLLKFGFKKEGHLRERWIIGGEILDSYFYGLLSHEWAGVKMGLQKKSGV